jgi:hypothetical protein
MCTKTTQSGHDLEDTTSTSFHDFSSLPSSHCVGAKVMKNWLPFVFGPLWKEKQLCYDVSAVCQRLREVYYLLAIDNIPAPVCFSSLVSSSSNVGLKIMNFRVNTMHVLCFQKRPFISSHLPIYWCSSFACSSWITTLNHEILNKVILCQGESDWPAMRSWYNSLLYTFITRWNLQLL